MNSAAPTSSASAPGPARTGLAGGLRGALDRLRPFRTPWVGEVLLREKVITQTQLDKALELQQELDEPIGRTVVEMGLAEETQVLDAINKHYRIAASALSENIAALIRSRAASRRSLSRLRRMLRMRLSLVVVGAIWGTIFILSLVVLGQHRAQLMDNAVQLGTLGVDYLAESAKVPLLNDNVLQLNRVVKAVTQKPGVRYGLVTDTEGIVRAHSNPQLIGQHAPPEPPGAATRREGEVAFRVVTGADGVKLLRISRPVTFQSKLLGRAELGLSLEQIGRELRREGLLIALLSLLIVAFGIVLAVQQGGRMLRPVSAWLASSGLGDSAQEYRVHIRPAHEFEDLAESFDNISRELAQKLMVERSFGRYVNPSVLEMIQANPDEPWLKGSRNEVSVLFTDVRGFTSIAESREPEALVEALNEYFAIASAAIVAEGGHVDKFIGDGVLAVFGLPAAHADHALRAVKAAVRMQKELKRRARNNLNPFLHRVGIGVNSGVVVSGNIGSEDKMEYTVIGDCVNLASRLTGLAEAGEVIISDSVAQAIPSHLVTLSEQAPQSVKGKKEPVVAYKVLNTVF
jgi:adenylate cyclase